MDKGEKVLYKGLYDRYERGRMEVRDSMQNLPFKLRFLYDQVANSSKERTDKVIAALANYLENKEETNATDKKGG